MTREAIQEKLWEPGTFVDSEHGINFCVREIRAALGDNGHQPCFIETLPRRGYRFLATATVSAISGAPTSADARGIQAYEHYLRGRANLERLGKSSLEEARENFERALSLDPNYAMAHSGLGATHAMRTIYRRDPDDLQRGTEHLTRALELDPELAEPYPWLCYLNIRQSRLDRAIETGRRAIELQPDLVHAHYFLGLAYFAAAEQETANYQPAADHLMQATRVAPAWQASWFVLAYAALTNGDYQHASHFARRLLELNGCRQGVPFIGAELVLASVSLREGRTTEAREVLSEFRVRLSESDHMYRHSMSAIAACQLGDAELRGGSPVQALAAYRSGRQIVQEHTRMLAYQRIAARIQSGLASAYAALHETERALELLDQSAALTERSCLSEHAAAGAPLNELYWSLATASVRLGDRRRALDMLARAVNAGCLDGLWLEDDPELESLHEEPRFRLLADQIRRAPKIRFADLTE